MSGLVLYSSLPDGYPGRKGEEDPVKKFRRLIGCEKENEFITADSVVCYGFVDSLMWWQALRELMSEVEFNKAYDYFDKMGMFTGKKVV